MAHRDLGLRSSAVRLPALTAFAITSAIGLASAGSLLNQQAGVAFDVVSIKPNTSGDPARALRQPGGRFTAVAVPPSQIIRLAYDLLEIQMVNVPDWVRSERYDILAQAPDGEERLAPLLQTLLRERFAFAAHTETREMPIYEIVLARQDRRLGERIEQAAADCQTNPQAVPPAPEAAGPPCALFGTLGRRVMRGYPLSRLGQLLSGEVGRVVVDRTGLTGTWNLELEYSPQRLPGVPIGELRPGGTLPSPDTPSIFTALQEQLGLELRSARGPVQVLVVDSIARPTPD